MSQSVPFDQTTELLIYIFLVLASFCMGLSATLTDLANVLSDRSRMTKVLLANVVVPPLVAVVIGLVFSLEPAAYTMLLLVAFAPGGINAVQFSTKVPGEMATAGAILLLLSAVALVTAPIAASILLDAGDGFSAVPLGEVATRAALLIVLPAGIGMWVRRSTADVADKVYKPAMLISLFAFIGSVVLSTSLRQDGLAQFEAGTTAAFVLFLLVLMAVGWSFGGPGLEGRQILAVSTNLRNVGLVYVLAEGCCPGNGVAAAVMGLMAIMVLPNLVLTVGCAIWRRKKA